jgi:hypothetical protein
MASVPQPEPQVNPAGVRRGFPDLKCILCGESGGVRLCLEDLDVFQCSNCDGEFTAADVEAHVHLWSDVLLWVAQAPVINEGGAA